MSCQTAQQSIAAPAFGRVAELAGCTVAAAQYAWAYWLDPTVSREGLHLNAYLYIRRYVAEEQKEIVNGQLESERDSSKVSGVAAENVRRVVLTGLGTAQSCQNDLSVISCAEGARVDGVVSGAKQTALLSRLDEGVGRLPSPCEVDADTSLTIDNWQLNIDNSPSTLATYPGISMAASRAGEVPLYRIWLLLMQACGASGGWIERSTAITLCTAELGVFKSRRRMEQIIKEGEGFYWRSGCDRLYLKGAAQLAARLSAEVSGRKILVERSALTGSLKKAKATLYATWHAGREARPISRVSLSQVVGVSASTQRDYEAAAGVETTVNYSRLGEASAESVQEIAYQYGHNHFTFTDWQGKQGPVGARYSMRQLPNTYQTTAQTAPNGRLKKVRSATKDLVKIMGAREQRQQRLYVLKGELGRYPTHKQANDMHAEILKGGSTEVFYTQLK